SVAHLGAIILLFVTGLEFKLHEISSPRYAVIALFGVLLPWAGGFWTAEFFGFETHKAALIGVAFTATSIAITADTLREMGKLHSAAAKAIIGAAIIDDILALLALSVTEQVATGSVSTNSVLTMMFKAGIFLVAGAWAGRAIVMPLIERIDASRFAKRYPEFVFVLAMMLAFAYAMFAELMGLSAIVGAFVAGVAMEGVNLQHSRHFKEGAEYLRVIFGAIFFVSLGILADIRVFTGEVITATVAFTAVAILTKLVGCGLPARLLGMNTRDALVVGIGMAPRGEVAMIVALLALNQGVIEQAGYVSLVIMSLVTTLIVPLVLRNWLFRE
ncbi:MAG: cation:proton antiporter, partial [Gammaproteobacteria bacterium]|nr:cation:proton antiporter [Gammaproteobacteria bacterium]